jgi:hypothetical protein
MNPEQLLRSMCARLGLPFRHGTRLLPLVERAVRSPEEVRERLLSLVEANLAHTAEKDKKDGHSLKGKLDDEVLSAVARVLHAWSPSRLMMDLGDKSGSGPGAAPSDA